MDLYDHGATFTYKYHVPNHAANVKEAVMRFHGEHIYFKRSYFSSPWGGLKLGNWEVVFDYPGATPYEAMQHAQATGDWSKSQ